MEEKGKSSNRNKTKTLKLAIAWTGIAVLLVPIAIMLFAVTPVIAQEATVTVTVNAPEYVEKGGTFVATIDVDSVTDFGSANFDLSFDHDVTEVSDVKDGEIDGENVPIYAWLPMDADNTVRVLIMMPMGECVSGSGYIAKIEFDVRGEEGDESKLDISKGILKNVDLTKKIPANWINATVIIGVPVEEEEEEDDEEEEVGEEVIPGSPTITAWKPAEAVVSNAVGESGTFNITVNQIADISWQINGTEVQTNESVAEAAYTNMSAVIGTWNVSVIATNTTTGLSDMHMWIWSVTLTPTATVTPTPTLAPGATATPEAEAERTPTSQEKKPAPKEKATPVPAATPTPKPPGFEAIFAIAVILGIAYRKMRKGKNLKKLGGEYKR
jgi:hypothetical protein